MPIAVFYSFTATFPCLMFPRRAPVSLCKCLQRPPSPASWCCAPTPPRTLHRRSFHAPSTFSEKAKAVAPRVVERAGTEYGRISRRLYTDDLRYAFHARGSLEDAKKHIYENATDLYAFVLNNLNGVHDILPSPGKFVNLAIDMVQTAFRTRPWPYIMGLDPPSI